MTSVKEFDSLMKSLLYIIEDIDTQMQNSQGTLKNFTINEMHCIDYIKKAKNPNVTKLSKALNITRGGISRLIKKLINKGAVQIYTNETNRKEIYYKLTSIGKKVFDIHKKMHYAYHKKDIQFFKQFSKKDIETGLNFIKKYIEHAKQQIKNF